MKYAYCYASGEIDFGTHVPSGALPICRIRSKKDEITVSVLARLAYDGVTLLVPGIPEAKSQKKAMDALFLWLEQLRARGLKVGSE